VLLAYNTTKHARSALAWASQLQRTLPAEVAVVAVQENGLQATDEWLAEARSQLTGCQCVHRLGHPAREIIAVAEETETDLIVMGRYRHIALLEWFVGSTVDRVLRGTQLPILMA
jgi:nucleotide-binding universal stress UspA family protein